MAKKKYGYELRVRPLTDDRYKCELRADPVADSDASKRRKSVKVSSLGGWRLDVALGFIQRILKKEGYPVSSLTRNRKSPFHLGEEGGVKLDLAFRAIKDLQKRSKIEEVLAAIETMSREEALYWHSQLEQDNGKREKRGLKAMRILLGGE